MPFRAIGKDYPWLFRVVCCHSIRAAYSVPVMPNTDTSREYLTPAQAARRLGISPRTLWRYQDAGRIAPVRLPSGHRRFLTSDVEALAASA
jgi:excisionase family DNA binding protein